MEKVILKIQKLNIQIDATKNLFIRELELKEKQFIGLYAPTGTGKTTLLNTIAGIKKENIVVSGDIIFAAETKLSYVFQKPVLLETKSVKQNLLIAVNKKINIKDKNDLVNKWIKNLNLNDISSKKVKFLSGGERQRVCIARAFCNEPDLLLFDEPFSSQDEKQIENIQDLINREIENRNICGIIVSHNKEHLKKMCSVILTEEMISKKQE